MAARRYNDLRVSGREQFFFGIYFASILVMMIVAQFFYPSILPETIMNRAAWSLMIGIPAGWAVAILIHKLINMKNRAYRPW